MSWEVWGDPPDPPEMQECPSCEGTGIDPDPNEFGEPRPCLTCNGEGEIEREYTRLDDDVI